MNNTLALSNYNNWEHFGNLSKPLTFYIPLVEMVQGENIELMVLSADEYHLHVNPEIWLTHPDYFKKAWMILEEDSRHMIDKEFPNNVNP